MLISLALVLAGLALLTKSADQFVTGSVRIASLLKVSPFIVGALIMGFGTSAPEMLVSGLAANRGDLDLGVGNLAGSNLANITIVLGTAGIIIPVLVNWKGLRIEALMTLFATVVFAWVIQDGVERWEGAMLLVLLIATFAIMIARGNQDDASIEELEEILGGDELSSRTEWIRLLFGLVGTVAGAYILVESGGDIAKELGLSTGFVGLTLIAVGTSLPEMVTTIVAARRGHTDLIIGNLLGSNLLNSLGGGAVLGLASSTTQLADSDLAGRPMAIMVGAVLFAVIAMRTRRRVSKLEGIALVAIYVVCMPLMPS